MKPLILTTILIALVGQGCARDEQFESVLNSPNNFQGRQIEITGVFHYQFEDVAIYLTRSNERERALWINFSDALGRNQLDRLDRQTIKITGIFNKDDRGHLGQYAGSLDEARISE